MSDDLMDRLSCNCDAEDCTLRDAKARIEALTAEVLEQARLLGMSAERELALRAENERLRAENAQAWCDDALPCRQLLDAKQENERLREALVCLRDCDWVITPLDRMDAVRDIARAALEETQAGKAEIENLASKLANGETESQSWS